MLRAVGLIFDVLLPTGEMVADASGIVAWQGLLPVGGDYKIDVQADESARVYTLDSSDLRDARCARAIDKTELTKQNYRSVSEVGGVVSNGDRYR